MAYRTQAATLHLLISAIIAVVAWAVIALFWFPDPLDAASGIHRLLYTTLFIQVFPGPFLTFLIYKKGKKNLYLDLAIIVAIQLTAVGFGLNMIASQRPAWVVFNIDRFDLAPAGQLDARFFKATDPKFRSPPWTGPKWVGSKLPVSLDARNKLMVEAAIGGPDLFQRPDLYVSINENGSELRTRARPLGELRDFNPGAKVDQIVASWPQADGWLPLSATATPMVVLINGPSASVVAVVDLRPWN